MRCFIAILLPDFIRDRILEFQDELRDSGVKLKWVRPESIHLTLDFLDEITEEQAEKVKSVLNEAASQTTALELTIEGLGQFPPKGKPRLFWVGIGGDKQPLLDFERRIRDGLATTGVPFDKKMFFPHMTIGRVSRDYRGPLSIKDKLYRFRAGGILAEQVHLMRSELHPKGAIYTSLGHATLQPISPWEPDEEGRIPLPRYKQCFVCGSENALGLDVQFVVKDGHVETSFVPCEDHCGYRGVVHGGVLTAILDECMGWTGITKRKVMSVGAEVTIRFKRRALAGRRLFVSAECVECRPRLVTARGQITDEDGEVVCTGTGKFSPIGKKEMKEVEEYSGWGDVLEKVFKQIENANNG
ncbi:MAG: RNA 2',3'-cyclic phosphodiesterase [bacterium]